MPTLTDQVNQLVASAREHEAADGVRMEEQLFYVRFVNTHPLALFSSTVAKQGSNWTVHFYGDSAGVCATSALLVPSELGRMLGHVGSGLAEMDMKEIEIVAFKGDLGLFGSFYLTCKEQNVAIVESSLPPRLDIDKINRRWELMKTLRAERGYTKEMRNAPRVQNGG